MKDLLYKNKMNPIINSYWFWADPLLIIENIQNSEYWLYNNFINLKIYNYDPCGNLFFDNGYARNKMVEMNNCPFLDMQKINFDITNNKKIMNYSFEQFIEWAIKESYYILLMVNRQPIKVYNLFSYNVHQLLIYDYNSKTGMVYFCDNDANGKFRTDLCCSLSELEEAYMTFTGDMREPDLSKGVFLLKSCEDDAYSILWERIKEQFFLYLDESNVLNTQWWSYGIKVYECIINEIKKVKEKNLNYIDHKFACVLWDHKKVMLKRLEMIKEYFELKNDVIADYNRLVKESNLLCNLILKYNINHNIDILERCIDILYNIKEEEKRLIQIAFHSIPKYISDSMFTPFC